MTGTLGTLQAPEQGTNMFRIKVAELRQDVAEEHLAQESRIAQEETDATETFETVSRFIRVAGLQLA